MSEWTEIWRFATKRFVVTLDYAWEDAPDLSWDETGETREKIESGEWGCYCFRTRVRCDGREVAVDYLGNSVYADPVEFGTAHRDPNPLNRNCTIMRRAHEGRSDPDAKVAICHYFPDMVSESIREARKALRDAPRLRSA